MRAGIVAGVILSAVVLSGCAAAPSRDGLVRKWGTTREVLRDGRRQARVALADLPLSPHSYGVGALEDLRGEITIDGGTLWISESSSPRTVRTTRDEPDHRSATLLLLGDVSRWDAHPVTEDVPADEVDAYLAQVLDAPGRGKATPRPFVVEGPITDLRMHVIAGECPIRARMLDLKTATPPYELHVARTPAKLIGIYEPEGAGDMTHMGSDTHMHVLLSVDGETVTGHVEVVGLARGAVLRVPAS